MPDIVVVGAGIGGLTAAIGLAARGRRVLVLEAADRPGGKAGIVDVDGVEVDTGPSLLTLPAVFDGVFREAGTSLTDELTLLRPEPAFRYVFPDGVELDIHHEVDATLQSVCNALGPRSAAELAGFLRYAEQIWRAAAPAFVFGVAPRLSTLLLGGPSKWLAASRIDPFHSMKSAIDRRVESTHLRQILYRYATYNGSDVRRAPATLNCIAHVELSLGGFAVAGGMHELVRALVRVAERRGVVIRCAARVESIAIDDGRAHGVHLASGETIRANAVIANTDATHLVRTLLPASANTGIRLGETPSMSAHNAIVKARPLGPGARVAHTVVFPRSYLAEFADIFDRRKTPADPTIYICAQSACHRRAAWDDREPLFLMVNAPAGVDSTTEDGAKELAPLWEDVHARLVRAKLVHPADRFIWSRTPSELATRFPGSRGSLYGAASNGRWAAFRRPPNAISRVPGLYLASGTAHPGGGLPLAACSGRQAALALSRDMENRREVRP